MDCNKIFPEPVPTMQVGVVVVIRMVETRLPLVV